MFTNPKLLVLDEATSSLDAETEASVSAAIQSLRGGTTILMIAHRLATVRTADLVVYIAGGRILAQGTFAEVRAAVPDFDKQANLLGL
jgi:ATP-binding cassette subfamily C protein